MRNNYCLVYFNLCILKILKVFLQVNYLTSATTWDIGFSCSITLIVMRTLDIIG